MRVQQSLQFVFLFTGAAVLGLGINLFHPNPIHPFNRILSTTETGQCVASDPNQASWLPMETSFLVEMLEKNDPIAIADVRSAEEYKERHIRKAIHLPCQGNQGIDLIRALPSNKPIVFYDGQASPSIALKNAIRIAAQAGIRPIYVWNGSLSELPHLETEAHSCAHCLAK